MRVHLIKKRIITQVAVVQVVTVVKVVLIIN